MISSLLGCAGDVEVSGARETMPARAALRRPRAQEGMPASALKVPLGQPRTSSALTVPSAERV